LEKKDIRFDVFDPFKAQWEGELEAIEKANKTNDLEETAETEEFEETMDITNEPIDVAEQKESYMDII
jgi:type IV secretion system protein VirD4